VAEVLDAADTEALVADARKWKRLRLESRELLHAVHTTLAAVASLLVARLFRLPESYWAAITSMIASCSRLAAQRGRSRSSVSLVERNAFRYAGITLAIIMLIARTQPVWVVSFHRFVGISLGIAVGLWSQQCGPILVRPPLDFARANINRTDLQD